MSVHDMTIAADLAARRRIGATMAMIALVTLLALISLGIGPVRLSPLAVVEALFGEGSEVSQVIVREIRLPRTILALRHEIFVMPGPYEKRDVADRSLSELRVWVKRDARRVP